MGCFILPDWYHIRFKSLEYATEAVDMTSKIKYATLELCIQLFNWCIKILYRMFCPGGIRLHTLPAQSSSLWQNTGVTDFFNCQKLTLHSHLLSFYCHCSTNTTHISMWQAGCTSITDHFYACSGARGFAAVVHSHQSNKRKCWSMWETLWQGNALCMQEQVVYNVHWLDDNKYVTVTVQQALQALEGSRGNLAVPQTGVLKHHTTNTFSTRATRETLQVWY